MNDEHAGDGVERPEDRDAHETDHGVHDAGDGGGESDRREDPDHVPHVEGQAARPRRRDEDDEDLAPRRGSEAARRHGRAGGCDARPSRHGDAHGRSLPSTSVRPIRSAQDRPISSAHASRVLPATKSRHATRRAGQSRRPAVTRPRAAASESGSPGRHEPAAFAGPADDAAGGPDVRGEDRQAVRERVEPGLAEAFREGRLHAEVGTRQDRREGRAVERTREDDDVGDASLARASLERGALGTLAGEDDVRDRRTLRAQDRERVDQDVNALLAGQPSGVHGPRGRREPAVRMRVDRGQLPFGEGGREDRPNVRLPDVRRVAGGEHDVAAPSGDSHELARDSIHEGRLRGRSPRAAVARDHSLTEKEGDDHPDERDVPRQGRVHDVRLAVGAPERPHEERTPAHDVELSPPPRAGGEGHRHDVEIRRERDPSGPRRARDGDEGHRVEERRESAHLEREAAVRRPPAVGPAPAFLEGTAQSLTGLPPSRGRAGGRSGAAPRGRAARAFEKRHEVPLVLRAAASQRVGMSVDDCDSAVPRDPLDHRNGRGVEPSRRVQPHAREPADLREARGPVEPPSGEPLGEPLRHGAVRDAREAVARLARAPCTGAGGPSARAGPRAARRGSARRHPGSRTAG